MALRVIKGGTPGSGSRRLESWIGSFIAHTENLGSAEIFRKWAAITTISAALEQKVWITTSDQLFANLYTVLVGAPGVGKTRAVMVGLKCLQETEVHIAPTSVKAAGLVDALSSAKRFWPRLPLGPLEYNSLTLVNDELSNFMHAWDDELIGAMTSFYDVTVPYSQYRRTTGSHIKIPKPQLTAIIGTTPSNLMRTVPPNAWGQGFTSRVIFIHSLEKPKVEDDFAKITREPPGDLIHDLRKIYELCGEFTVTDDFRKAVSVWRAGGELPRPAHPRLVHYGTRRRAHIYKLAMVHSVNRSSALDLLSDDFDGALNWLREAELNMESMFSEGMSSADGAAMDEIEHFIRTKMNGAGVPQHQVVHFACTILPAYSVARTLDLMALSKRIWKDEQGGFRV